MCSGEGQEGVPLNGALDGASPREEKSFTMTVDQFIPTPLWRQATEAHKIAQSRADIIMNRKGEWGENLPPPVDSGGECKGRR